MSSLSSHVLDAGTGRPATGVRIELRSTDGTVLGAADTDADGRVRDFGVGQLAAGAYRLVFATGEYFAGRGQETFYPSVELVFTVSDAEAHYHVPILLSPFAFSTYRGS